jgi:GntR family transcriptional regulator / MocR family aminotransferase
VGRIQADYGIDLFLELGETRPAQALESSLRDAIVSGRLPPGHRLPPTRALAADLGIARATVSDVYAQLAAEGWLDARTGSGTWVADGAGSAASAEASVQPSVQGAPDSRIAQDRAARRGLIHMYGGGPDLSQFPRREWLAAARRAVDSATVVELDYIGPRGVKRLRQEIAGYLTRTRGVKADPELTMIGHGFSSLLSQVCRALVARGARRMAVEEYGHAVHHDMMRAAGLELIPLSVDREGADVSAGSGLGRADAVLLTAAHQYPLGVPLSSARRRQVVSWARATGGTIIEDDYDGEFRFDRRSIGALQGMAPEQVIYLGTSSKALAPAVGLAWAVVPSALLPGLRRQRGLFDRGNDSLNQLTLAEFFACHAYDRHVRRMRAEYRRRRELLAAELAARVPQARLLGVAAGLQTTIGLPPGTNPERAVAHGLRLGLDFRTLAQYAVDPGRPQQPAVVLAYGGSPTSRARTHIETAVTAIQAACNGES